ncbi:MAG TPA: hypothetical protein PKX92_04935 [Edaphocola sp.]|nr:hypothetical protein [Edaphocola sp.]
MTIIKNTSLAILIFLFSFAPFISCKSLTSIETSQKTEYYTLKHPLSWKSTEVTTTGGVNFQLLHLSPGFKNKENFLGFTILLTDAIQKNSPNSLEDATTTFIQKFRNAANENALNYLGFSSTPPSFRPQQFKGKNGIEWTERESSITTVNNEKPIKKELLKTYFAYTENHKLIIIQYQYNTQNAKSNQTAIEEVLKGLTLHNP